ncbi:hypothetical protein EDC01DRAFT_635447 [Geopyxis carbonaria]|nr:hypothetical protein EDC01DRAFT_635447 [Geopyxis carbonaria]
MNGKPATHSDEEESVVVMAEPDTSEDVDVRSVSSDNDNETVREKLKKTTIDPSQPRPDSAAKLAEERKDEEMGSTSQEPKDEEMATSQGPKGEEKPKDEEMATSQGPKDEEMTTSQGPKGEEEPRRSRKRSHDESDEDNKVPGQEDEEEGSARRRVKAHERKRSREITDEDRLGAGRSLNRVKTPPTHPEEVEGIAERVSSPRGFDRKRSLGRLDPEDPDQKKKISKTEEESIRDTDKGKEATAVEQKKEAESNLPSKSGFANTSVKSPFATSAASSTPLFGGNTGSANLFASSGFGALSKSSASPFGTLKSNTQSPFGALGAKTSSSPFGSSGFSSGFGSKASTSAFGSKATPSGFGSAFGSSTTGSSFATLTAKSSTVKPFGAPDSDDDKSDDQATDSEEGQSKAKAKPEPEQDKMADGFHVQDVLTGEENEDTVFKAMGKAYFFEDGSWKERGRGTIKLNKALCSNEDDDDWKPSARLIMRTEGTYTLIFNTLLYKDMKLYEPISPTQFQFLLPAEGGKMITVRVKLRSAQDLYEKIKEVYDEVHDSF